MANSLSAKKRIRQNEKRRLRNKALRSSAKTAMKKVLQAVEQKDLEKAKEYLKWAMKRIDKAAKRNVFHWKNAARKKSKLCRLVAALEKELTGSS